MTYTPTIQRQKRTRDRIVIDGEDVTWFRDAPAVIQGYELTQPYGYGPATLAFPQISALLEEHNFGIGDLAWVRKGAFVRIDKVDVDTNEKVSTVYRGRVFTHRVSNGLTLEVAGYASGPLSQRYRPQQLKRRVRDVGRHVSQCFRDVGIEFSPAFGPETGIEIDNGSGGMQWLGWVDHCLAMAQTNDGNQWTVMPKGDTAKFEMRLKDLDTIHATVWLDAFGVSVDVVDDVTEQPNAYTGSGVGPDGGLWVNGVWPNLGPEQVPPFPMPAGQRMVIGTTNADTTNGSGVSVLKSELRSDGLLNVIYSGEVYNEGTAEAIETVQERAGLPVTGEVDEATWAEVWGDSTSQQSVGGAEIRPLVVASEVEQWLYTANGSRKRFNPDFDETVLRVDKHTEFGAGVHKHVGRRWSRREMRRANQKNYVGSITLSTDVWAGDHAHGTAGTIMDKESLRPGMNLKGKKPGADIVFHIVSMHRNEDKTVTLTVDTQARDALHVGELLARDAEARRDPARSWLNTHRGSQTVKDSMTGWYAEDGAGLIRQKVTCPGGQWTHFPVIAGQEGTIQRITLETTPAAAYVLAVSAFEIEPETYANMVGNPLVVSTDGETRWTDEDVQEWLHDQKIMLYVAGDGEQPCGYWPKKHTDRNGNTTAHPVTGKHRDYASVSYRTFGDAVLWVAGYFDRDTVIEPQELFRGQNTLGA